MNTLQELFENSFKAAFSEEKVLLRILTKKLKEQGFVLSEKQIKDLENKIINNVDLSTYKFDENEALKTPDDWKKFQDNGISIAIDSEKDLDEVFPPTDSVNVPVSCGESGSRGFFSPSPHTTRHAGPHRAVR